MTRARDLADWGDQVPNAETAWTSWTPTWTNFTVGNAVTVARYKQIGKTVYMFIKTTLGTTSSVSGSAAMLPSLPVNAKDDDAARGVNFSVVFVDTGTATHQGGMIVGNNNSTRLWPAAANASGTYLTISDITTTVPFTWTSTDIIFISAIYEAA